MKSFAMGGLAMLLAIAVAGCASNPQHPYVKPTSISFTAAEAGHLPPGFSTALTGGGGPVSWVVQADPSAPPPGFALVQTSNDQTSYRFPMCIYERPMPANVTVSVRFKSIAGTVDQAGGIVLRYSPENYYIARANALEDNVNLFKTVNGNRIKIDEVDAKVAPNTWHTLTFTALGDHLQVIFDGRTVIDAHDKTFRNGGDIGLWTKADSVTAFTDLKIFPRD